MPARLKKNVARLFAERLNESEVVNTRIEPENEPGKVAPGELLVLLGIPGHHNAIGRLFDSYRIPGLTELSPGPEGFLLRVFSDEQNEVLLVAGTDDRGCLYAVGEILRRITGLLKYLRILKYALPRLLRSGAPSMDRATWPEDWHTCVTGPKRRPGGSYWIMPWLAPIFSVPVPGQCSILSGHLD